MTDLKYTLVSVGGEQSVSLFHDGEIYVANSQHPNWTSIKRLLDEGDESVVDQFDVEKALRKRFARLSTRVTVSNGEVLFDGDSIDPSLSKKITDLFDSGSDEWEGYVAFLEKVMDNPSVNSREQLYTFLTAHDYELLPNGNILGYKGFGLTKGDAGETLYVSTHAGTASVNDVEQVDQRIRQQVGDTVTMPRSAVQDNPDVGCSYGLHVADFDYARSYGTVVMAVEVNPRDVVSVPRREVQKVRACRYTNLGLVSRKGEWLENLKVADVTTAELV